MRGVETSALVIYAKSLEVQRASGLADRLRGLDVSVLIDQYEEVRELAPRRGQDDLAFFVDRKDAPIARESTDGMREDLLEMALINDAATIDVGDVQINLLMRQFPLFSKGSRRGLKAVDLVGHGGNRFWAIELKVPAGKGYGETPLRALLESLIYCAVVEANADDIRNELASKYNREHNYLRPGLIVAAPTGYWRQWTPKPAIGDWWIDYTNHLEDLGIALEVPFAAIDLGDISHAVDTNGTPHIQGRLESVPVHYRET